MNDATIHTEIRTTIARLELCSTASVQAYNPSGGPSSEHPGGRRPPGVSFTAADWYRHRLACLDAGQPRRIKNECDVKVRDTYEQLLGDTRDELAAITGRTEKAPERRVGKLDTEQGIDAAVKEDAHGKPAEQVAASLGLSVFIVRRIYVAEGLDPHDGHELSTERQDRELEVARLAEQGMGERQIGLALRLARGTVRKAMGKAA